MAWQRALFSGVATRGGPRGEDRASINRRSVRLHMVYVTVLQLVLQLVQTVGADGEVARSQMVAGMVVL